MQPGDGMVLPLSLSREVKKLKKLKKWEVARTTRTETKKLRCWNVGDMLTYYVAPSWCTDHFPLRYITDQGIEFVFVTTSGTDVLLSVSEILGSAELVRRCNPLR
mmetsp:Transcript_20642/g.38288  ORF Transcript_20642/g.38288 Transcript_20642/m.38288 type:complete len:105 (+) Transcript_20642:1518-1832(+)